MSNQPKFVLRDFDPVGGSPYLPIIHDGKVYPIAFTGAGTADWNGEHGCFFENKINPEPMEGCQQLYIEENCDTCDGEGTYKYEDAEGNPDGDDCPDCPEGKFYKLYRGDKHSKIISAMAIEEPKFPRTTGKTDLDDREHDNNLAWSTYDQYQELIKNELEKIS